MATRRSDIVRRSLFGSDDTDGARSTPETAKGTPTRQRRGRANASRPARPDADDTAQPSDKGARRQVERTAITVPTDLLLQVKDAVAVLNGWPHQYTMARFVEEAFTAHLERLKAEHNGGRAFPVTNRKIRTGRPPGT